MKLKDLNPDPRNANKGTARGQKMIVSSIQEDGFGRSGLLDRNGQIIAGNKTAEASAEVFGVDTDVIVVETDGKKPVYVKRTDLDLADPDPNNPARRLAYRDNLASRFSFELDAEVVMADIEAGFDFEAIGINEGDFRGLLGQTLDGNYNRKIEPPTYTPTGSKPLLVELFDQTKTKDLIDKIAEADGITEEEKDFLRYAAQRHTIFNFKNIAEYYAHSNEAMQALMEDNALVIIDFDKAISSGFVQLTTEIAEMFRDEYGDDE